MLQKKGKRKENIFIHPHLPPLLPTLARRRRRCRPRRTTATTEEPTKHADHSTLHTRHLLLLHLLLLLLRLLQPRRSVHSYLVLNVLVIPQPALAQLVTRHLPLRQSLEGRLLAGYLHQRRGRLEAKRVAQTAEDAGAPEVRPLRLFLGEALVEGFAGQGFAAVELGGDVGALVGFQDFAHVVDGHAGDVFEEGD